ncbi:MAG: hypothetical protein AAGC97_00665 [Planctomycetota bacterium]
MTQRERFLALAVGGLIFAVVVQWGFGKYRTALNQRRNRVSMLQNDQQVLNERKLNGAYADRQMGEYLARSLPSDPDRAQSDYQSWLLDTVRKHGLSDAVVDPISVTPVGDLYRRFGFRVSGRTQLPDLVDLLYAVTNKDYLQRIREMNFGPTREGDLNVEMTIDSIALGLAPSDAAEPSEGSWRVASDLETYRERILNRNFFQPPNQPPRFNGSRDLVAYRGRPSEERIAFEDPEQTGLKYSLAGELPDWARFDPYRGAFRFSVPADLPQDSEPLTLTVTATDSGYPRRQNEQQLTVRIANPPPPPQREERPGFDDASETYLTALVRGGGDWRAWMNVRPRGKTLKLRVGDAFEIGSVKGTVIEVTPKMAKLEIDGRTYEFRPDQKLTEAVTD